jgi:hypothetical protein
MRCPVRSLTTNDRWTHDAANGWVGRLMVRGGLLTVWLDAWGRGMTRPVLWYVRCVWSDHTVCELRDVRPSNRLLR